MENILSIIASVIGIVGALWAIIKFLLKPYLELKKINMMIDDKLQEWRDFPWFSGGRTLIKYEDFFLINKYKERLRKLDDERLAFLLRNAIQHGKTGGWGYWLVRNKDNDEALFAILTAIGAPDEQPRWRAAYILQVACGRNVRDVFEKLPDMPGEAREKIKTTFDMITSTGTEEYLKTITDNEEKQKKAQRVLEEIEMFSEFIKQYAKRRQQRLIVKRLVSGSK